MTMISNLGPFSAALAFFYRNQWIGSHQPFFDFAAFLNISAIAGWVLIQPDLSMTEEIGLVSPGKFNDVEVDDQGAEKHDR